MTTAHSHSQRSAFWDRHAFSVGQADFHWVDVAISAMAHGDWPAFERRLTEGLACAARAESEHYTPDEKAVDEAATAFRYERDLISAADMRSWLERAGLSTEEWMAFVERDVLRRLWADEIDDVVDRFAPPPRRLEATAVAEGICSGLFDRFEQVFAGRVSIALESPESGAHSPIPDGTAVDADAAQLARRHAHWLTILPADDPLARVVSVLRIERRFREAIERIVSAQAIHETIATHHLQWVRLTVETIAFDEEPAALEAVLCVQEDGLSLHDVGALSRRGVHTTEVFLEDVPASVREQLRAAEIGSVLGPLSVDGRFEVSVVTGRTLPTRDDRRVVERARQTTIQNAASRAAREHVTRRFSG